MLWIVRFSQCRLFSLPFVAAGLAPQLGEMMPLDPELAESHRIGYVQWALCVVFFVWYLIVVAFATSGWYEIMTKFTSQMASQRLWDGAGTEEESEAAVSIIRPCRGIEPEMAMCLESCIKQEYPPEKLEVLFCVESEDDECLPILTALLAQYPTRNLKVLVGREAFGPNPKVNNLAKAYRSAQHDIVWILDSNVWAPPGMLRRSVASLAGSLDNGRKTRRPVVLTHHIPLGIGLNAQSRSARLEEMFLFSSHAKFYVAFNKVGVAPCVNGKSNLYRRSALNRAVQVLGDGAVTSALFRDDAIKRCARLNALKTANSVAHTHLPFTRITWAQNELRRTVVGPEQQQHSHGIEFFSTYIGEDNMIGTALWDMLGGRTGMTGQCVYQPLHYSVNHDGLQNYFDRRVRWQRVRKYMVLAATLLEPTTESILIGLMGSYALPRLLAAAHPTTAAFAYFVLHMAAWCYMDRIQYNTLVRTLDPTIAFGHRYPAASYERPFYNWLQYWLLREVLAFPIWIKAMSGSVINWRDRPFRIKPDLTAESL
ncbi:ACR207Wp [Eremothecium gossypii ATCC 10895]|uniref:Ceramide glucosyltransferase n=1 Tax=Eremothecium gossypii (strain ATCC 10895 / CBS 109.51 / FGSC 9923 / NRRL Y-1056) TaxID=284811 RepID=Q75BR4_EREGS|nr:ACR207Wp [Eremothecium gossypii ATCC 10895]AAS51433.2 ACR207Wp [Eremothecium gossypii ATCC 10895]